MSDEAAAAVGHDSADPAVPYSPLRWHIAVSGYLLMGLSAGLATPAVGHAFSFPAGLSYGLLMALLLLVTHGVLWTYLGSVLLKGVLDLPLSIQAAGHCFLRPALVASGLTVLGWLIYFSDPSKPVDSIVRGGRFILVAWGLASIVGAVSRLNHFSRLKSLAFAAWWLLVLLGSLFVWRLIRQ